MANKYSSLYNRPADAPNGTPNYRGPTAERAGTVCRCGTIAAGAHLTTDVLFIADGFIPGEIFTGIDIIPIGTDSNITTANIVLIPKEGGSNITVVAATALFDGILTGSINAAGMALAGIKVPNDGKTYQLAMIPLASGAAGAGWDVVVRSAMPA